MFIFGDRFKMAVVGQLFQIEFLRRHVPTILILQGVLAWVPFAFLKYIAHEDTSVAPYLAWHLLGVLPGFLLKRRVWFMDAIGRLPRLKRHTNS